jgi:hypothetical protein
LSVGTKKIATPQESLSALDSLSNQTSAVTLGI